MRKLQLVHFALGIALFTGASAAYAQSGAPPAAPEVAQAHTDAAEGQRLFRADACWECHGTGGQGGGAAGPRIAATALPYEAFLQQLRTPMNQMPPFEAKVVSDADATKIFAFLQSQPKPRAASDIPLLNP